MIYENGTAFYCIKDCILTIINLYSDRLEIISLGGLVSGMTMEATMLGASQPRNEKLASLFFCCFANENYTLRLK